MDMLTTYDAPALIEGMPYDPPGTSFAPIPHNYLDEPSTMLAPPCWKRVIFFTDEHRPYHKPEAVNLSLQIAKVFNPDLAVVGSDGLDYHQLYRKQKRPGLVGSLEEVERVSWFAGIEEKRSACSEADFYFIGGNHEARYYAYIIESGELFFNPELALWKWLRLDELGIEYELVKQLKDINGIRPVTTIATRLDLTPNLTILHGDYIRKHSGWSARAQLDEGERHQNSLLMGHSHRIGVYVISDKQGEPIGAWECGHHQRLDMPWLGDRNPNWQWGLTLVEVQMEPPYQFAVEQVLYIPSGGKLRARWRGEEYVSR